jgi:hypothetical protein
MDIAAHSFLHRKYPVWHFEMHDHENGLAVFYVPQKLMPVKDVSEFLLDFQGNPISVIVSVMLFIFVEKSLLVIVDFKHFWILHSLYFFKLLLKLIL